MPEYLIGYIQPVTLDTIVLVGECVISRNFGGNVLHPTPMGGIQIIMLEEVHATV